MRAEWLFLLTDVAHLYTRQPQRRPRRPAHLRGRGHGRPAGALPAVHCPWCAGRAVGDHRHLRDSVSLMTVLSRSGMRVVCKEMSVK